MRLLAVIAAILIAAPDVMGQGAPPAPIKIPPVSDWIGMMESTDDSGVNVDRTEMRIVLGENGTVTGSWRSHGGGSSGNLEGTLKAGQFKLAITFRSGAENVYPNGNIEPVAPERCKAEATFTGTLLRTGVIRLTTNRIPYNDEIKRAKNIACQDERNVTWLLEPRDH